MRVLVTGGSGFLGQAVVAQCRAAGIDAVPMIRPVSASKYQGEAVVGDLRQKGPWCDALGKFDAVIHCAAGTSGDLPSQLSASLVATENLIDALPAGIRKFVHISSFSVYDFEAPGLFGTLDESTPIEKNPRARDAYTEAKLAQEDLVVRRLAEREVPLAILRPGAIYGPGKLWDYGAGLRTRRLDFIFAPLSRMRLTHVDNCARACVAALGYSAGDGNVSIFNVVDDEQPSHWAFHRICSKRGEPTGFPVPVPYTMVLAIGAAAKLTSWLFFAGKARLPEFLALGRQRVRWRPLRYPNRRAREVLGWAPLSIAQTAGDVTNKP